MSDPLTLARRLNALDDDALTQLLMARQVSPRDVRDFFDLADALRRRQQTLQLVVPPETFVADVMAAVSLSGTAGTSETLAEALEAVREPAF
jgi:hypothetical protein